MILALALAQAAVAGPPATGDPVKTRYEQCVDLAEGNPATGAEQAARWRVDGGGYFARQCEGIALANGQHWPDAAAAFEEAAHAAELAHDRRSALYWSQAGNAWLASGDTAKARGALDAALATGLLDGLVLGEAHLDRARVLVAGGDLPAARVDLDAALVVVKDDPLAWLLSATLARRMGDLPRAQEDIIEALRRAPDAADVELERGNIAAARGDAAEAQAGWREAMKVEPASHAAANAAVALTQFEGATPAR